MATGKVSTDNASTAGAPPAEPAKMPPVTAAAWSSLRDHTDARIALGRCGVSQPTAAHLALQLAHAQARDAVQLPLDAIGVAESVRSFGLTVVHLHSAAIDRATYLRRPDLGRRLDDASAASLAAAVEAGAAHDVAFVVADGLSALAIHDNAVPLLAAVLQRLRDDARPWTVAPVAVVEMARVAVGDEVGSALRAAAVVVLIGERPGLSSPDSLGIYLTWAPRPGRSDAERNCISNVRAAGLALADAAGKLHALLSRSRELRLSGVELKDESPPRITGSATSRLLGAPPSTAANPTTEP